ncbi:hypothetical protein DUNSADRAFT_9396 [Dunaliella salina]|uniref:YchJ-like middle NTF2-like domain-containing protein n=1 Tax=Dunaliella salina TaxID=3046 RepID=A0ABQ7GHK4_DUNSA|nr:hypothetical protein DUNSADRAFT_9396 [Dunaliella salina]|eukprot:KAF5834082.1 hypothetical protein DUNSADRAFT_9396 [Dunaliella salina]
MQICNVQIHSACKPLHGPKCPQHALPATVRTCTLTPPRSSILSSKHTHLVCAAKGFGIEKPKTKQTGKASQAPVLEDPCPCQSGKTYKNCCQKVHLGNKAKNVEAALRARFSAFVKGQQDYIKATTHRDYFDFHYMKPQAEAAPQFDADVHCACSRVEYSDFKVTQVEPGSNDLEGFVAFAYKHASKDKAAEPEAWSVTNQKCRFLKVDDMWQFVDYQTYDYNMSQLAQDVKPEQLQK